MLNQLTTALVTEQTNIRSLEARSDDLKSPDGAVIDMTARGERQETAGERRVRDPPHFRSERYREGAATVTTLVATGARTHRDFEIERHQDRLERRPS